jgi:HTH-type transcriptional regulator/antitoxin HigA
MIRESTKKTAKVDKKKYGQLLRDILPSAITNDKELDRLMAEVDRLISKDIKRGTLSPEEDKLLELLNVLIEKYEDEHYPIPELSPHEVLKHLMKENKMKQSDLLHVFGSSGIASEVVNGKRAISKAQAKALAKHFNVSVEVFI